MRLLFAIDKLIAAFGGNEEIAEAVDAWSGVVSCTVVVVGVKLPVYKRNGTAEDE